MSPTVTVTVAIDVRPESLETIVTMIPELLAEMLTRPGALSSRALQNPADPTKLLFVDEFESVEAATSYFAWRGDRGDVDRMGLLLSAPPKVDVWPISILPR
ncbi:MAG: putative quinol monooxygenase [Janthinobacterium lividum]